MRSSGSGSEIEWEEKKENANLNSRRKFRNVKTQAFSSANDGISSICVILHSQWILLFYFKIRHLSFVFYNFLSVSIKPFRRLINDILYVDLFVAFPFHYKQKVHSTFAFVCDCLSNFISNSKWLTQTESNLLSIEKKI